MPEITQRTRKHRNWSVATLSDHLFTVNVWLTIMILWPSSRTVHLKILFDAKQNLRHSGCCSVLSGFDSVTYRSRSASLLFAEVSSRSFQETANRMNPVTIETFFSVSRLSPLTCTFRDVHTTLSVRLTQPQHEGGVLAAVVLILFSKECLYMTYFTSNNPSVLSWLSPFVYPPRCCALSLQ